MSPTSRPRSESLFTRAQQLMPGGVSSPVRAFKSVAGRPVFFRQASGCHVIDEDEQRYVDYCMSWGPLILGHAHPRVVEAVCSAAHAGLSFGACCRREAELAELIVDAFPDAEQVRFVSSGTEAVMTAIRLARAATGRTRVLKFDGGYHGHFDTLLVSAGSGLATLGIASSAGVPTALAAETVVCPLDDRAALEAVFAEHGDALAAAIVEPLPANNGLLEQQPEWLQRLRELTTAHGALLIFDEVISGFRLRFGGYGDGHLGVRPDLVTLGKIIGGGMPVGALAGPRALLERLAPVGDVYQAGTLSGNPVALAAGLATLETLATGDVYAHLEVRGAQFDAAMAEHAAQLPWLQWRRVGSLIWLYLDEGPIPRRADAIAAPAVQRFNRIHGPLLDAGHYLPPSAYEVLFLSAAHGAAEVRDLATAIAAAARAAEG